MYQYYLIQWGICTAAYYDLHNMYLIALFVFRMASSSTVQLVECFGEQKGDLPTREGDLRFPSSMLRVILKWKAIHITPSTGQRIRIMIHIPSLVAIGQQTEEFVRKMVQTLGKQLCEKGVLRRVVGHSPGNPTGHQWESFECRQKTNAPLCIAISLVISMIRAKHVDVFRFCFFIDRPAEFLVRSMAKRVRACCFLLPCENAIWTIFKMADTSRRNGPRAAVEHLTTARQEAARIGIHLTDEDFLWMCFAVHNIEEILKAATLHEAARK